MSEPKSLADRNLLFGVLALQSGVITEAQLIAAMKQWTFDKRKPLSRILVEQSALTEQESKLLQPMVDAQIQLHAADAGHALNSMSSIPDVAFSLRMQISDDDVQASLNHFRGRSKSSDADVARSITVTSADSCWRRKLNAVASSCSRS